jgi:hypothetical protein
MSESYPTQNTFYFYEPSHDPPRPEFHSDDADSKLEKPIRIPVTGWDH